MRDSTLLALRMQTLLGLALVGCTRGDPQPNVQPDPTPTSAKTTTTETTPPSTNATTDPTPTAPSELPPNVPHFSCPSENWCGTSAQAAPYEQKSEGRKMSCPVSLSYVKGAPPLPGVKLGWWAWGNLDEAATTEARTKGATSACCYTVGQLCGGGRPLLDEGRALVAPTRPRADWSEAIHPQILDRFDEATRRASGEEWLADAQMEHASIASFARASMELMAVGAPAELIEGCHRAALDEVRHARICFALARALLGRDVGPGPMPLPSPRACSIADVARDAFVEGCVGETISALVASRAAERCEDAVVRRLLQSMARDEEAHATLAFRIVAWCVRAGGREVVERVGERLVAPRDDRFHPTKQGLFVFGRLDGDALAEVATDAWRDVIEPTTRALLTTAT